MRITRYEVGKRKEERVKYEVRITRYKERKIGKRIEGSEQRTYN